ncbi:IclR family transcriptional regulator [soil metagenome]
MSAVIGPAKYVLQGVEQSARLLELVAGHPHGIRLSELTRQLKLPKATVYRTAVSWRQLGYLDQLEGGEYVIGSRVFLIASAYRARLDLGHVARPALIDLNRRSGETVHLAVLDGDAMVYLDKVEGRQPIQVYTAVGTRAPLHATASGKAVIAHIDRLMERWPEMPLRRFTDRTITTRRGLARELEQIREQGYAVNTGEWHAEVAGVGVPVFDHSGSAIAAVSITFPQMYLGDEQVRSLVGVLKPTAGQLSARLGYLPQAEDNPRDQAGTDGERLPEAVATK